MKTKRRHELQTNVLADWLGHQIDHIRPYSRMILLGLVTIGVVGLIAAYAITDRAASRSQAWTEYYAASFEQNPEQLRAVAEQYPGTTAATWALLTEADLTLSAGLQALYTDREAAEEALARAEESYRAALQNAQQEEVVRAAHFGLAQIYEARSDLDEAKKYYQQVARDEATVLGQQAAERLELLTEDKDMERFYNWFARQEPEPPAAPETPGGVPEGLDLPGDLGDLPDRPDFPVPAGGAPSGDATPPAGGAMPAPGEATPGPGGAAPLEQPPETGPGESATGSQPPSESDEADGQADAAANSDERSEEQEESAGAGGDQTADEEAADEPAAATPPVPSESDQ